METSLSKNTEKLNIKVETDCLFPLYGIFLGKTTKNEILKLFPEQGV